METTLGDDKVSIHILLIAQDHIEKRGGQHPDGQPQPEDEQPNHALAHADPTINLLVVHFRQKRDRDLLRTAERFRQIP